MQAAKSRLEKLVVCEPKAVADSTVEEAKAILLTCKQHKEGLSKTLHKGKVLLDSIFSWQTHSVSEKCCPELRFF